MEGVSGDSVRGEVVEGVRKLYRLARPLLGSTALSRIPCGVCPVSVGRGEGWREEGGEGGREEDGGGVIINLLKLER